MRTTHQPSFARAEFAAKKKITRRERFSRAWTLPFHGRNCWPSSRPSIPKANTVALHIGLERMLWAYFLQQWYGLADEALLLREGALVEATLIATASWCIPLWSRRPTWRTSPRRPNCSTDRKPKSTPTQVTSAWKNGQPPGSDQNRPANQSRPPPFFAAANAFQNRNC